MEGAAGASEAAPSTEAAACAGPSSSPSGSPGQSSAQQQPQDSPMTPETASSGSDGVPTPTESTRRGGAAANGATTDQNGPKPAANASETAAARPQDGERRRDAAAVAPAEPDNKTKRWFEVIPKVLHNFRSHDREQIKQLTMPRCSICIRSERDVKAEFRCKEEGCTLLDQPLCSSCWKNTHQSKDGKEHKQLPASICPQCQLERIAYWCAECDLKFCRVCFDQIHSVAKAKQHRKLATEGAPGTCLAKSDWSAPFQNAIMQLITARKHPASGPATSERDSTGPKRKREVEVIVIDDDDDDDDDMDGGMASSSSAANGTPEVPVDSSDAAMNRQNGNVRNGVIRPSDVFAQLNVPVRIAPAQSPVAEHSTIEPIPFPQELTGTAPSPSVQPSLPYSSSSMLNGTHTANISSSVDSMQWNNSVPQFAASAGRPAASTGYGASATSNGMMEMSSSSASMNSANGVWSTTSAISTDLASMSNPTSLLPLGGAVFAENALVDSLVDRYHEVNQTVLNLELQTEQFTRQIAVATCQGPFAAGNLMASLNSLQPILTSERNRRDNLFIAMIIQSQDIMAAVRLLRLTELGDVPQVPMISHRKCLQISNEINQHKKKLIELNQELTETLTQSNAVSSSWETSVIRTTSANIQMHEKSIKKLKKDREVEIVRIVQFSRNIRETLKKTFQRTVELQRQRQQQQQQQQQFQQYG
ncbi:Zinc finger, B-box [Phytophthora cinnamomi]|uniref:Zinc finger, B-box n=1 Tax=Phytophthora cinnamomi TaxID=4785 RepID=UPI00355AA242|nr:Zinc finger, B-box [Phytophthora cinnamomi]